MGFVKKDFKGGERMNGLLALFGGILAGLFFVFLLVSLAVYIYAALALMTIAKKTKTPNGWLAFIPLANVYLLTQLAEVSGWYTLILLVGLIPILGSFVIAGFMAWFFWRIAERLKKPGYWGILMLIPIVNLILLGILAWEK